MNCNELIFCKFGHMQHILENLRKFTIIRVYKIYIANSESLIVTHCLFL